MALIEVGKQAPAFTLTNQDNKPVTLSQHAGKYLLLWWYPKADTPGWTVEGKGFRDRIQQYTDKNAVILGISFDTPEENRAFRQHFGFPYDLCSDVDRSASAAYGAAEPGARTPRRVSVLIDPSGNVVATYQTVTPTTHPDEVLADLDRMAWDPALLPDRAMLSGAMTTSHQGAGSGVPVPHAGKWARWKPRRKIVQGHRTGVINASGVSGSIHHRMRRIFDPRTTNAYAILTIR